MESLSKVEVTVWRSKVLFWSILAVIACLLGVISYRSLAWMVHIWSESEAYGYGFMIPVITLFFIWQRKDVLEQIEFKGSWVGVAVTVFGVLLLILGKLSSLYVVMQYSFLMVLYGVILAFMGWQAFRHILVPMFLLLLMIPLPDFLYQGLSTQLQLISSELGVAVIRAAGISVYLEGNVIDLGSYKLQVVEACSGLNYLFPLMSLSFIVAYLFKAPFWKRAVIFLSSIPVTVLMNSFRIGVIGILVEYGGVEQAEGFLHYFEGWIIFMACLAVLFLEMWILGKIGPSRQTLRDSFELEFPDPSPVAAIVKKRRLTAPFIAAALVILAASVGAASLGQRAEIIPERVDFSTFPTQIGVWDGKKDRMEQIYIDALKFDDYFLGDYVNKEGKTVNFYAAYYGSQRAGESAHSPRSCIPGGGWQIKSHEQATIELTSDGSSVLPVNRLLIQKGDHSQLVYYWFDQRGRKITNEYLVKWYLFWDSLTRKRTDGALVRLTAFIAPGEDVAEADKRLTSFARDISGLLTDYIPD